MELPVTDLARAVDFYRRLGFEVLRAEERFAELAWEGQRLFLADDGVSPVPGARGNLRILVPDVDACVARALAAGARLHREAGDRGYGLRDAQVLDPDGNVLRFATPLRG